MRMPASMTCISDQGSGAALRRHNADLKEQVQQISDGKVRFAVSAVYGSAVLCNAAHDACAMQAPMLPLCSM